MTTQPVQRYSMYADFNSLLNMAVAYMDPDIHGAYVTHSDLAAVEAERDALAQRLADAEGLLGACFYPLILGAPAVNRVNLTDRITAFLAAAGGETK